MDATGAGILLGVIGIVGLIVAWYWWQFRRVRTARTWPTTEATIQSGEMEVVADRSSVEAIEAKLPVFAFSYKVAGEYYSGRFSIAYCADNDALIKEMVNRKFQVHYNPAKPSVFFAPDNLVSSYLKVEQKLGPHFAHLSPRN